jgi:hypothetical protein
MGSGDGFVAILIELAAVEMGMGVDQAGLLRRHCLLSYPLKFLQKRQTRTGAQAAPRFLFLCILL